MYVHVCMRIHDNLYVHVYMCLYGCVSMLKQYTDDYESRTKRDVFHTVMLVKQWSPDF